MTRVINQRELRNDSAAILRAVAEGESFIVTRQGTPTAEIRPLSPRKFVPKSEIARGGNLLPVDAQKFRADLDSIVDQDLLGE